MPAKNCAPERKTQSGWVKNSKHVSFTCSCQERTKNYTHNTHIVQRCRRLDQRLHHWRVRVCRCCKCHDKYLRAILSALRDFPMITSTYLVRPYAVVYVFRNDTFYCCPRSVTEITVRDGLCQRRLLFHNTLRSQCHYTGLVLR